VAEMNTASQLENALDALRRGFWVHPCEPRTKAPAKNIVRHGIKDATRDEAKVQYWWKINPDFNPAVNAGVVVDCDTGLTSLEQALEWAKAVGLPPTLTVRTGRRPDFGVQFHYTGKAKKNGPYDSNGVEGEIRLQGMLYGMAPGSIHPSGERYEIVVNLPIAHWPLESKFEEDALRTIRKLKQPLNKLKPNEKIKSSQRQYWLVSQCGRLRGTGLSGDPLFPALRSLCDQYCESPKEKTDEMLRQICESGERNYGVQVPEPVSKKGVLINSDPGSLNEMITLSEQLLDSIGLKYFERNNELVHTVYGRDMLPIKGIARDKDSVVINIASHQTLVSDLDKMATFTHWTKNGEKPRHVPPNLPAHLHDRVKVAVREVPYKTLIMVTASPVLLPSGEITHDFYSEGVLFSPIDRRFYPKTIDRPTKEDAAEALKQFESIYSGFPFIDPEFENRKRFETASYSVALSGTLSLVARPYLRFGPIPIHAVNACSPRYGKSKIAKAAVAAGAGHLPTTTHFVDEEEFGKHLLPLMRAGDRAILIDNIERILQGGKLCVLITENIMRDRLLGESKDVALKNVAVFFATGNNLVIGGDLATRALRCDIDEKIERPESRKFEFDPVARALERHPQLVTAACTALRSYILAGTPWKLKREPWGGFEDWDRLISGCLTWLGYADPYETRDRIIQAEPNRLTNSSLLEAWRREFQSQVTSIADIKKKGGEVYELLLKGTQWDAYHVQWVLRKLENKVVGSYRLERLQGRSKFWVRVIGKNDEKTEF
jgi:hypothetical protein